MFTMSRLALLFVFLLSGCVADWHAPDSFIYQPIKTELFEIASWQKITDNNAPIHIYIEGDGRAFNAHGVPTDNPTPHDTFMRDLAASDSSANVVYIARPCQFIMSPSCTQSDWTDGRFSTRIIDSMAAAISDVAGKRPIILIGYSGGAMISGLIIQQNPDMDVRQWITIAGVLNHSEWTNYFGDSPLTKSVDLDELPNIAQTHYVGQYDKTVPIALTRRVAHNDDIVIVPNATHSDFGELRLNFLDE